MYRNQVMSYIRFAAATGAGYLLTFLAAHFHIVISEHTKALASAGALAVLSTAYYYVARFLEERWPKLGVLLGAPVKPSYAPLVKDLGSVTFDPADQPKTGGGGAGGVTITATTTTGAAAVQPPAAG